MKYLLCEYEHNGYDDSDFYAVYFDDETGSVNRMEVSSTRYGGHEDMSQFAKPSPEILDAARMWLSAQFASRIRRADYADTMNPDSAQRGEQLRLLSSGTFKDKRTGEKISYREGEVGEVVWFGHFGKFYRNGYNKPDRFNARVGLRLNDGRTVFVAMEKCRRDRELMDDETLRAKAEQLANSEPFYTPFAGAFY